MAMKTLRLHVIESTVNPGELSLRLRPDDRTGTPFMQALTGSGAVPGDVVELRAAVEEDARFCHECGQLRREGQS